MKAQYSRSSVEPVQATQRPDGQLALRYRILPESQFYSKGVDFREHDGTLQVFIKRCGIDEACAPMAPNVPTREFTQTPADVSLAVLGAGVGPHRTQGALPAADAERIAPRAVTA